MEAVILEGVDKVLAHLNPRAYMQALNRTINDVGSKTKTRLSKGVRRTYNIKAGDLNKFMKVRKSRYSDIRYTIDVRSRRFNAMRFGAKVLKQRGNVSVKIRKDTGRKVLKRAFTAKNGAVLQRVKGAQEIRAVTTVSIPQMFNDKLLKDADKHAQKELRTSLQNNFNYYIGKA
ncbi:MAG TPA: hypothetical protein CFH81_00350 [Sulfurovum sp. UBA12169]|nr:MAG TPA: hypothetical protein CFH81_00350 [Sulfurovum sp. UBA12169]